MAVRKVDKTTIEADVDDVFQTPELKAAYEGALPSLEAGRHIAKMREAAGLTQAGLAKRLRISQARVSAIENGEGRDGPTYALLKRITAACGGDLVFVRGSSARSQLSDVMRPQPDAERSLRRAEWKVAQRGLGNFPIWTDPDRGHATAGLGRATRRATLAKGKRARPPHKSGPKK